MTRLPSILLLNILGVALFLSWFIPENHGFWFVIDSGIFHFFNHELVKNKAFLWLVAITNNRAFDACALLCMGLLMLSYWRKAAPAGRRHIVIMGIVMLLSAVIINQLAQRVPISRLSPTLFFPDAYRVSDLLNVHTKDASKTSFPGDHGMMLLIFSGFMLRYFGMKAFRTAIIIVVIFCLPRMMIGAHWFTDVMVGSLSAVLIGLPWFLMTPLSDTLINWFNNVLPGQHKTKLHKI